MTEQRLWALYCVLDFSYREINEITNWASKDVKCGLQRKWNLSRVDPRYIDTDIAIHMGVGRALGFEMDSLRSEDEIVAAMRTVSHRVSNARQALRERVMAGTIGWDVLDALDISAAIELLDRFAREESESPRAA